MKAYARFKASRAYKPLYYLFWAVILTLCVMQIMETLETGRF